MLLHCLLATIIMVLGQGVTMAQEIKGSPYKQNIKYAKMSKLDFTFFDEALKIINIKPSTPDSQIDIRSYRRCIATDEQNRCAGISVLEINSDIYATDLLVGKYSAYSGLTGMVKCGKGSQYDVLGFSPSDPKVKSEWVTSNIEFSVLSRTGFDKDNKEVWQKILTAEIKTGSLGKYLILKDPSGNAVGVSFLVKPANMIETQEEFGCDTTNAFADKMIRTSIIHFLTIFNQVEFSDLW